MRRRLTRSAIVAMVIGAAIVPVIDVATHTEVAFACTGPGPVVAPLALGGGSSSTVWGTRNNCQSGTYIQAVLNERDPFCYWNVYGHSITSNYTDSNSGYTTNGAGIQVSPGQLDGPPNNDVTGSVYRDGSLNASNGYFGL